MRQYWKMCGILCIGGKRKSGLPYFAHLNSKRTKFALGIPGSSMTITLFFIFFQLDVPASMNTNHLILFRYYNSNKYFITFSCKIYKNSSAHSTIHPVLWTSFITLIRATKTGRPWTRPTQRLAKFSDSHLSVRDRRTDLELVLSRPNISARQDNTLMAWLGVGLCGSISTDNCISSCVTRSLSLSLSPTFYFAPSLSPMCVYVKRLS